MCSVLLDLKMLEGIRLSTTGKSATVLCGFSGWFDERKNVPIEVLFTGRVTNKKKLSDYIQNFTKELDGRTIIRVIGELRCLRYQDRTSGKEVERYQVYADAVYPSPEKRSLYSNVVMEGFVRPLSNAPIVKGEGKRRKASFWISAPSGGGDDREGSLSLLADGFDGVANQVERMKLREKSHVLIVGKLLATSFDGVLGIHLFDVNYAALSAIEKKE